MKNINGYLTHLYHGKQIHTIDPSHLVSLNWRVYSAIPEKGEVFSLDQLPQEYPGYGSSDFRQPAYQVQLENGSTVCELKVHTHRIYKGKPKLSGLPATYVENDEEAETLEIVLKDELTNLTATLIYTVFENYNVITRSVLFKNQGDETIRLLRALSVNVDFPHDQFDFLHLSGRWGRERWIEKTPLRPGTQAIESRRGASGHQQNPFVALLAKDATEHTGEVYGYSFVYSGNFIASAEVDQYETVRVTMGINPFDFSWLLEKDEQFQTPEVVMTYSDQGLNGMSQTFHDLYRNRLMRGTYRNQVRPILINNWEGTYFDFTEEKLLSIAESAKEIGIELFVLDDGWFGKRDNDQSSLGDWSIYKRKLPHGLEGLVKKMQDKGLQFGLWFEPEMVSADSDLYREHPDWCLHVPNRRRTESRHQFILDFSRKEVREAILEKLTIILESAPISYVKWDMNRNMTEIGTMGLGPERQRETAHRYMIGLYEVLEKITSRFPDILFESCAGGGGRFDPGMLYYMPQTWTSDNTDAVERLKIQYGTSLVYPIVSMGSHVSDVPNHQVHRFTSLKMRGDVAFAGTFGYELDLSTISDEETAIMKEQVEFYKLNRKLLQYGRFYRLLSPFDGGDTSWIFVSEDQKEAILFYYQVLAKPNGPNKRIRPRGLNQDWKYEVSHTQQVFYGNELMNAGLSVPYLHGDFASHVWKLKMKE